MTISSKMMQLNSQEFLLSNRAIVMRIPMGMHSSRSQTSHQEAPTRATEAMTAMAPIVVVSEGKSPMVVTGMVAMGEDNDG